MPKEHISGVLNSTGWRFSVGWDKQGGLVQVSTNDPNGPLGEPQSGLWVDVNRDQINEIIRALRKARDQAFGKDE